MKRFLLAVLVLLAIGVCFLDAAPIHRTDPEGSRMVGTSVPLPTTLDCSPGHLHAPAFTVSSTTAAVCPALPTGTTVVRFYVYDGIANAGPSTVGSDTTWPSIASGSLSDPYRVSTLTPTIYFIGRSGATPSVRPICW
ncbi:MAG: hypothetical protein AB1896_23315 [Thermodesulfobacteriota bacterium]